MPTITTTLPLLSLSTTTCPQVIPEGGGTTEFESNPALPCHAGRRETQSNHLIALDARREQEPHWGRSNSSLYLRMNHVHVGGVHAATTRRLGGHGPTDRNCFLDSDVHVIFPFALVLFSFVGNTGTEQNDSPFVSFLSDVSVLLTVCGNLCTVAINDDSKARYPRTPAFFP